MKKAGKYLKMLPVIAYPYLYMAAILINFIVGAIEDNTTQSYENTMLVIVLSVIAAFIVTSICLLLAIFNSVRSGLNSYGVYFPVKMNLIVKCVQIPAYVVNFIVGITGVLMSIWGIGFVVFAVVIDFLTISISGINNVGDCVNLCRNNILSKGSAALFSVLSFIYLADVFASIYLFVKVKNHNKVKKIFSVI